ncbi:MAG: GGDEF domain-containing protein [Spirochaetes bacterium]|jgi:diguanylate cyclase (GGDEF)-like protein|nr:GGDEF domain-containing protein [Spirochaetota bacterium]
MDSIDRHEILEYIIEITEQRDAELLEESLVRTVYELFGAERVLLSRTRNESPVPHGAVSIDGGGFRMFADEKELVAMHSGLFNTLSDVMRTRVWAASPEAGGGTIVHPVTLGSRIIGFLIVYMKSGEPVDNGMIGGLLRVYHNYLSILAENQRDKLTSLLNRKTFDDQILKIIEYHRRSGASDEPAGSKRKTAERSHLFWLGMIDIDNFKKINDSYGHLFGDEVLILVANLMVRTFRHDDFLFRYGGEEFLAIIRAANEDDAVRAFERFRSSVESYALPRIGTVTVSVGAVQVRPGDVPTAFVGHADQALYHAKKSGKNRVCVYERLLKEGVLKDEIDYGDVEFF